MGGGQQVRILPLSASQVKAYLQSHPYPPPINLITLPFKGLCILATLFRRKCLKGRSGPRASSKVEAEPSATQGAGGSGPTNPLQRQSTKVMTANMEERARQQKYNPYAKCTFPKSKAQAVEERARQQYLVRTSCLAGL